MNGQRDIIRLKRVSSEINFFNNDFLVIDKALNFNRFQMMVTALLLFTISLKGVWVPRWALNDGTGILDVLDGRFDHIFLQVFALGETYYPSQYAVSVRQSDQWLTRFLDEAHSRHIRVSAWINLFYSWGYAPRVNKSAHPINRYPAWYVQDKDGRSIADYSTGELEEKWIEGYYLAPGSQQVKSYLLNIIIELLDRYPFDGIHFDYVRYPGPGFIYDPALRSLFMRSYGIDPIESGSADFICRYGNAGNNDIQQKFRNSVINDLSFFISQTSQKIKEHDPGIMVSAAVKPDYHSARRDYYQDWPTWLNNGSVDLICLMSYGRHIDNIVDKAMKITGNPERVAVGIGVYMLSPDEVRSQVLLTRSKPCAGFVCFSYDQIKKDRAYLDAVR